MLKLLAQVSATYDPRVSDWTSEGAAEGNVQSFPSAHLHRRAVVFCSIKVGLSYYYNLAVCPLLRALGL